MRNAKTLLSEFEVFLRPEAGLGGVWGSNWHQTPILHDLGGQNGVLVGSLGGTGDGTIGISLPLGGDD